MEIIRPNFEKRGGLVTVVARDVRDGAILMVASTNEECFRETLRTGEVVYYSTSKQQRWKKGETSGNIQEIHQIFVDCDGDALIYVVDQKGSRKACHTGAYSCFYRDVLNPDVHLYDVPKQEEGTQLQRIAADVSSRIANA